jgi:hypothetical protein
MNNEEVVYLKKETWLRLGFAQSRLKAFLLFCVLIRLVSYYEDLVLLSEILLAIFTLLVAIYVFIDDLLNRGNLD